VRCLQSAFPGVERLESEFGCSIHDQQLFEATANVRLPFREVNFQKRMTLETSLVERPHRSMTLGINKERHFIGFNRFLWELPD
jgi:hypothetical protein